MALVIENTTINRILIIEDDPSARSAYTYPVDDMQLESLMQSDPIVDLEGFLTTSLQRADAAIADHHLRKRNYATTDGAELVARWYPKGFPALLCTRYDTANLSEIRRHRRFVPVLLTPDQLSPEAIAKGLELCVREFRGDLTPARRPWRTLIRVEDVDNEYSHCVYVVAPGWNANKVIRLEFDEFPSEILPLLVPDCRLHAKVNIGAEHENDLYFAEWEGA
jgi:hypothetical protein